ncbi:hypothetical protein ABT56_23120 [Photobacterium aquae]|uniref:Uncharacterized protein n=2 Tax=Photobacterium aquae TaxID=1195763 RepID=A0A0J1GGQ9_9GAMM|nr:hypothetical protein ABT56_23120 [Photobacterium aquae]
MNIHKELYKLFYQAERLRKATCFKQFGKCPFSLSKDAIRMTYGCGIDIACLFDAQAAAARVMVNRFESDFPKSRDLQDIFDGGEL